MFSKDHLDKILSLNEEHTLASPERQKEIEREICQIVPDDLKSNSNSVQQLSELQKNLKHQISKLADCATKGDFDIFFKSLSDLDEQIHKHGKTLGIDLPRNNYESMKRRMMELKLNANK